MPVIDEQRGHVPGKTGARELELVCPACRRALEARPGIYHCRQCGAVYPVEGGIIRMVGPLEPGEAQVRAAFDFEHRRYQTARYLRISPSLIDQWLEDVRLPREYFDGRTVLDAGCGTGRWTYALAALGAHVVAVDFSEAAVSITRAVTSELANVQVIQANLLRLPFTQGAFDFVVSWGVLHHTPDTARAFRTIAPLVRPGGRLHVMVYERRSPLKVLGTELLRMAMRRLPAERRYRLCGRLIIKNKLLFNLCRGFVACIPVEKLSEELDAPTAQFGLYDWYSPRFNHLHTVEEVRRWFDEAGYDDVQVTSPIKYTRALEVLRFGACGGSITCRGRRRTGDGPAGSAAPG